MPSNVSDILTRQKVARAQLCEQFTPHSSICQDLQRSLLHTHPAHVSFLSDLKSIFRFLRTSQWDASLAAERVQRTLAWRGQQQSSGTPPAASDRLLFFSPETLTDHTSSPLAVLRLRYLSPAGSSPGRRQQLQTYFFNVLDDMRQSIASMQDIFQVALLVDVSGAGYANLVGSPSILRCLGIDDLMLKDNRIVTCSHGLWKLSNLTFLASSAQYTFTTTAGFTPVFGHSSVNSYPNPRLIKFSLHLPLHRPFLYNTSRLSQVCCKMFLLKRLGSSAGRGLTTALAVIVRTTASIRCQIRLLLLHGPTPRSRVRTAPSRLTAH